MSTLLETLTNLLKSSLAGEPPPPTSLQNIGDRLNDLLAVSLDPTGSGIDAWLSKLRAITGDQTLRDTLLVRAIQMHFPRLAEALTLVGIVDFVWNADGTTKAFSINWVALNNMLTQPGSAALGLLLSKVQKIEDLKALQVLSLLLISSPQELLELEYEQQGFAALPLPGEPGVTLDQLIDLINSPLRLPLPLVLPLDLATFMAIASPAAEGTTGYISLDGADIFDQLDSFGIEILIKAAAVLKSVDLGQGWQLTFTADTAASTHYRIKFNATGINAAIHSEGDLTILLSKTPADANALLIGEIDGTHFAVKSVQFGVRFRATGDSLYDVILRLEQIEFALKPDFLKFLSFGLNLPTLLQFNSNINMSYMQGKGLSGQGSLGGTPALGVQFAAPLNLKIGGSGAGVNVDQVTTRLEVTLANGDPRFRVSMRYSANAQFGPITAMMDGAGVWFGRWTEGTGGLLPPQGIGLTLNAGPVSGGGFLKIVSSTEFAGALELKILGIGAFAYGLFKVLPDGSPSFVALIGIRLPLPGVQIGFGFAVSGFGGLVGINRRADTDVLRERLTSGSAGDVLFNDNPTQNAPRLLGDMQRFFPDEKSIFLIGPTLQINWLYILKLDVGVFIELPGPRKIFIAGSARLVLGSEAFALVYLRMDFVGGIDLTKSLIFFDAALVNSHVLGVFRITGGVALRIAYGDNGYFLFTVGGFHPAFNPGAMELPRVARVGTSVDLGVVWLKQEMYLAITSNTFQLGARIEAGLELGPISAHGWIGFDALIQFKPFYFVARIDAGFDVEVAGVSLCSVHVSGQLSGPGPLVLQGEASVKILFVRISGSITVELNSNPPESVVAIPDLPHHLLPELKSMDNLRVEGEDRSVVFAPQDEGVRLFAPIGALIWEQKRAPLKLPMQKVEGVNLEGWHRLEISVVDNRFKFTDEEDWFGVGTYLKMNDGEALNNAKFVKQASGIRIGSSNESNMSKGGEAKVTIKVCLVKLPKRLLFAEFVAALRLNNGLASVLAERGGGAKLDPGAPRVSVQQETWKVHDVAGNENAGVFNSIEAFGLVKQTGGVALSAADKTFDLAGVL